MRYVITGIILLWITPLFAGNPKPDSTSLSLRLDSIVVRSDKYGTSLNNSPAHLEILDEVRVQAANGNRLSDILKSAGSVFVKSYGPSPQLQSVSINGLGTEHTIILLDGVKLNSFQNAMYDLALLPRELIGSIAIETNGASALYGSEAMGGVISILSKRQYAQAENGELHSSLSLMGGSEGTFTYSGRLGMQTGKTNFAVFFSREKSNGDFRYHYFDGISTTEKHREMDAYALSDVGGTFSCLFDPRHILNITLFYGYQDKQIPGIETGGAPAVSSQFDRNLNALLSYEHYFSKELFLKLNSSFLNSRENYSVKPILNSFYLNIMGSASAELQYDLDYLKNLVEYSYTHATLSSNELSALAQRNQHSVVAAIEGRLFGMLRFFPSLREEYFPNEDKEVTTYKLGANLQPLPNSGLSLRGNYGRNFRMPTFNDIFWKGVGSTALNPEYSQNTEVGVRYETEGYVAFAIDGSLTRVDAQDKIIWMPQRNGLWHPINIGKSLSKAAALNITAEKAINSRIRLRLDAGLTFTDSRKLNADYPGDPTANKLFPYVPTHALKLGFTAMISDFTLNMLFTHTGDRYADLANLSAMTQTNIVDGSIAYDFHFGKQVLTARIESNNVFNQDYQAIIDYPMPLRTYTITITFNY
jgi:iron complex outermembrane receptor protein